jgi:hypothetical protein
MRGSLPEMGFSGYASLEKKVAEALDVAGGGVASDNKAPDIVVRSEIFLGGINHPQLAGVWHWLSHMIDFLENTT